MRIFQYNVVAAAAAAALATVNSYGADFNGKIVWPEGTKPGAAKVVLTGPDGKKVEYKATSQGTFAFTGLSAAPYKVEIIRGRKKLEIPTFGLEEGKNDSVFYFPPVLDDKKRNEESIAAFEAGTLALQAGNYGDAISKYTSALTWDTAQAPAWGSLSLAYVGAKKWDDAVFAALMAIRLEPGEASYLNNLGSTYFRMRQYEKAVERFLQAAQANPDGNGMYLSNAGAAYVALGKSQQAIEAYSKAVADEGCPPQSWYHLGYLLANKGEREPAIKALNAYLDAQPTGEYAESAKRLLSQLGG